MRSRLSFRMIALAVIALTLIGLAYVGLTSAQAQGGIVTASGYVAYAYGDPQGGGSYQFAVWLSDANGNATPIRLDEDAARTFAGRGVTVTGTLGADGVIDVQQLDTNNELALVPPPPVTGTVPYINLLCRFSGNTSEPKAPSFFNTLMGTGYGGMNNFFQTMSNNQMNINGSGVASSWLALPKTASQYFSDNGFNDQLTLTALANDCIAAHDPTINFSLYNGINMHFNDQWGSGSAWGGVGSTRTLDGVTRQFRNTWMPPWGQESSVMAHEMGHSVGYPHSSSSYPGNPRFPYDQRYDVMSDAFNCGSTDPTLGCISQGTIAYHLNITGWIPANRKVTVAVGTRATITLDRLNPIVNSTNPMMVTIPISGSSRYYVVEARQKITGNYDVAIPGNGVVIWEVDTSRSADAQVQDATQNSDPNDDGAYWVPGETFTRDNITIRVLSAEDSRYTIRVANNVPLNMPGDTVGVFRPSAAFFYLKNTNADGPGDIFVGHGAGTDLPFVGDWNGDGIDTVGVFRDGTFYLKNQNTTNAPIVHTILYGVTGDVPVVGDWNNDGIDTIGIYRNTVFMLRNSLSGGFPDVYIQFGGDPSDVALAGDWNGDGIDTPAIFRSSSAVFYLTNQSTNGAAGVDTFVALGAPGDVGFSGDWDNNGTDGVGIFRPTNGITYLRNTLTSGFPEISFVYGAAGDKLVAGRWLDTAVSPDQSTAPIFVPRP